MGAPNLLAGVSLAGRGHYGAVGTPGSPELVRAQMGEGVRKKEIDRLQRVYLDGGTGNLGFWRLFRGSLVRLLLGHSPTGSSPWGLGTPVICRFKWQPSARSGHAGAPESLPPVLGQDTYPACPHCTHACKGACSLCRMASQSMCWTCPESLSDVVPLGLWGPGTGCSL